MTRATTTTNTTTTSSSSAAAGTSSSGNGGTSSSGSSSSGSGSGSGSIAAEGGRSDAEFVALERRIFALETFLGSATNAVDVEGGHVGGWGNVPLVDVVSRLEKQLASLDPAGLDALRTKAAAARTELEAVGRAKTSAGDNKIIEAVKKVEDLHEQIQRVQAVAGDLPALVLRLKTLEAVHQGAASFAVRLQALERVAQGATEDLKSNSEVLGNLKQGLAENLAVIKGSIAQVDGRISKLSATS